MNEVKSNLARKKPKKLPVVVYSSDSQLRHPLRMLKKMVSDSKRSFGLSWRLAVRDISSQYRQTLLGLTWAFMSPLVTTLTWVFLNSARIITVTATEMPYPIYVFTGTMLWQIFTESLRSPNDQVNSAKAMLTKVNFPKEAIIVSGILQTLFSTAIKIVVLIPALLYFGFFPKWSFLLVFIGIISLMLAGTALGLLLVPIGALYHDLSRGIGFIIQFWMYITPVVFTLPKNGLTSILFNLNPITPLIQTSREWLTGIAPTLLPGFFTVNGVMLIVLFISWIIYRITMPILVERMSA